MRDKFIAECISTFQDENIEFYAPTTSPMVPEIVVSTYILSEKKKNIGRLFYKEKSGWFNIKMYTLPFHFSGQVKCIDEVERRGLSEVGIYRVPG